MTPLTRNSAFSRVIAIAEQRTLHEAFRWMHIHASLIMQWQAEMVAIPAPPFGEAARSAWLAVRFAEAGLWGVEIDAVGNVFGAIPAKDIKTADEIWRGPVVLLTAHVDTVFPAGTPLIPKVDGDRLEAPGACDNGAGVAGMLGLAHALIESQMELPATLIFVGNVGEEGEGDLRGVRQIYQDPRFTGRIAAHLVLDGAGTETAVTQALGSRRYLVTIHGPGGHSFTDAGTPNPIMVMALALSRLSQVSLAAAGDEARATLNVGTIAGGTSVNSIPESATATVEFRSTDLRPLLRLEVALHRAVEDAVDVANAGSAGRGNHEARDRKQLKRSSALISFAIDKIGDRPAAYLPTDSTLMEAIRAVDRHLGLRTDLRLGSTDANIPLFLGVQAVSLGAGGDGGGAHTRAEWYSAKNRELGLRRVLLLALTVLDWAQSQTATQGDRE